MNPVFRSREWYGMVLRTIDAVCRENNAGSIASRSPEEIADSFFGCIESGWQVEHLREWAKKLGEESHIPVPPPVPVPTPPLRLVARGRNFFRGSEVFRICFAKAGTLLVSPEPERYLDWVVLRGFNGVRIFAGDLPWASQSPQKALEQLPRALQLCEQRGLYAEVTALTETGRGYDWIRHLTEVTRVCLTFPNTILEAGNEINHPTQVGELRDPLFREVCRRIIPGERIPWALGALVGQDEPLDEYYPGEGGSYITSHLDRSRDKWNQVRRVRELFAIWEAHRVPVLNNEPIGWGPEEQPGRRTTDPEFFFVMGLLNRLFDVGTVGHGEHALHARLPTPIEDSCALALVAAASRIIPTNGNFEYRNVGSESWRPVKEFEGGVRAYSFVGGEVSYTMCIGHPDPRITWSEDWRPAEVAWQGRENRLYRIEQVGS